MAQENILNGGIESLYTLKETLLEINGYQDRVNDLEQKEALLEQDLEEKKQIMDAEMNQIITQRKNDISRSFDEQIDKIRARIKKTQNKKEKSKNAGISKRIEDETFHLRDENQKLQTEAKTLFRKEHIPSFCFSRFYYALFAPKGIGDIGILLLCILVTLLLIPCAIYFVFIKQPNIWLLVIIYFIDAVCVLGLYRLIYHITREKHPDAILSARHLMQKIKGNNKKINAIKNSIKKDSDDSQYNLGKFDKEIEDLEEKCLDAAQQKNTALSTFESETKPIIVKEKLEHWEPELKMIEEQAQQVHQEIQKQEDKIKDLSLELAHNYEGFLGKDLLTIEKLNQLISFMESGKASTVSEAIICLRQLP